MTTEKKIELGDHGLSVADEAGFRNVNTIWDDPGNAEIKKKRFNPNVLAVGDKLVIPDQAPPAPVRPVDAVSLFTITQRTSILNLDLADVTHRPRKGRSATLTATVRIGKTRKVQPAETVAAGDPGRLTMTSDQPFAEVDVRIQSGGTPQTPAERFVVLVGHLGPLTTRSGQQARLNNMGYFAGFSEKDEAQFLWAVEEFQTDHRKAFPQMKRLGVGPDGSLDRETQKALGKVHGDLLPGQEASLG